MYQTIVEFLNNHFGLTMEQFLFVAVGVSLIINAILFLWNIIQQVGIRKTKKRYENLMRGNKDVDLEELILSKFAEVEELQDIIDDHEDMMEELREDLDMNFSKSALVRYDAFDAMAGKLSFALAILNQNDTGYLLNVLYGREGCYTYVKEIVEGRSEIELSEEEAEALQKAIEQAPYYEEEDK